MRQLLFRPVIFVSFVLGLLVIGELLAIGRLTWVNGQRIHTIERDIDRGRHLEKTIFELLQLQLTLSSRKDSDKSQQTDIANIQNQLIEILKSHNNAFSTPFDLNNVRNVFTKAQPEDQPSMMHALELIEQVLDKQASEEENLLVNVKNDSKLELQLAMILPLLLFWIGHYFFKTNVLEPMDSLKELLSGLAEGEMKPIERDTSDPLLHSLFDRYNHLVSRLLELEQEHLDHTKALEYKVRETSHALLEQSQQLAKAERLAALAELAASTAHELRNPLASIQLALENMLQECVDVELSERMQMVYREVKRLTRNLNDLLASARSSAESSQKIDVRQLLDELLMLLKFQAQENIKFSCDVTPHLQVFLPESEFRQMLLNLLLNSIQAIAQNSGAVNVTASSEHNKLIMTITDTGPGFNAEVLKHGIRPFVSLKDGGTGLGLAMVQRFVKDHHGHLHLQNTVQGHAQVTFSLPMLNA
ncbi:GHKL domain-containing protein [Methylomonas paludis]|uniref:histidine kinase n=1 Tax=Methylomonas paludis TaxID=1173101 RepID=A0A975MPB4_9GAMM|nr:ATP-binding protein [Methylomonas paludis]QWF71310.1 GHKL domain-containing protein [Methylomonas paludis]